MLISTRWPGGSNGHCLYSLSPTSDPLGRRRPIQGYQVEVSKVEGHSKLRQWSPWGGMDLNHPSRDNLKATFTIRDKGLTCRI
jgi:hypothetical protein